MKGIKLRANDVKNLAFYKCDQNIHAPTVESNSHRFSNPVLDVLVELKALLIMHEINRKYASKKKRVSTKKKHEKCISLCLCAHVCVYVDKTWNKSKSTALGRIFHLTVTKSTKHLYSFKPNKFFVSSHIHVVAVTVAAT